MPLLARRLRLPPDENAEPALLQRQTELAVQIARFAEQDGIHATAVDTLSLIRASQPTDPIHAVHKPALSIVAQGREQVTLADEVYLHDASQYLVVTLDLPIVGQVVQASRNCPYLCLRLDLEPAQIGALLLSLGLPASSSPHHERGLFLGEASLPLIEAALRLLRLLDTPEDIPVLAPSAICEILCRLLMD
ncbi:MAG: AraC family transcriptional regulator [Byssovorax sp.]